MHGKLKTWVVATSAVLLMAMMWVEYELWNWTMLFDFPVSEFSYLFAFSLCFIPVFLYVLADERRMEGIKLVTCVSLVLLTVWGPIRLFLFVMFPP